jgi:hypothetical protein
VATSKVAALGRDGAVAWSSFDSGGPQFSPLAAANGVLYTLTPGGTLTMRNSATGDVVKQLSVGGPSFGGISTTGRAVYVSVGTGPPPSPAPQQAGSGSIMAFGDTSKSGAAGGGGGPTKKPHPRIRLSVRPRSVTAGRRTLFRFTAHASGTRLGGARVRFAGHTAHTNRNGIVRIKVRLRRGKHVARATKSGFRSGSASVRARSPARHDPRD